MSHDRGTVERIDLGTFEVVHAVPNPAGRAGYCFGSEDGDLLFTDERGRPAGPAYQFVRSGEAVNGVAAWGDHLGVSTRADITIATDRGDAGVVRQPYRVGAHGLTVTSQGVFVASAGRLGWVFIDPVGGRLESPVMRSTRVEPGNQFYQTVALPDGAGADVLAAATRAGGLVVGRIPGPGRTVPLRSLNPPGFNAVDVCAVGPPAGPRAVAVAGLDGTVLMCRDVLAEEPAESRRLGHIQGTVYRLLCLRGHLVVLTSRALYILLDAVDEFLASPNRAVVPRGYVLPVKAVDADAVADRYVLVVQDTNVVLRVDVQAVADAAARGELTGPVARLSESGVSPRWTERADESAARPLVAV